MAATAAARPLDRSSGTVTLDLPGHGPIPLRLDFNAIADLETETGRSFTDTLGQMGTPEAPTFPTMRYLLWAMSGGAAGPFATPRDAGDALTWETMGTVFDAVTQAVGAGLPAPEPEAGDGAPGNAPSALEPTAPSASTTSSRSPKRAGSQKTTSGA